MLRALGAVIGRRAGWFVGVWLIAVTLGFAASSGVLGNESLFSRLQAGKVPSVPGEAQTGLELLNAAQPPGAFVMLLARDVEVNSVAVREVLAQARTSLSAIGHVVAVGDPALPAVTPSPYVGCANRCLVISVQLDPTLDVATQSRVVTQVDARLGQTLTQLTALGAHPVIIGSTQALVDEINGHVKTDLRVGEAIALPLSLLVMLVVFAGLIAAGLPILGAIASIAGGLASLLGFSYALDLDASVPSVVSILGLGLSIDYGLLLVSRFREEAAAARSRRVDAAIANGADPALAQAEVPELDRHDLSTVVLVRTVDTAGRTIAFSGITVAISLAGLTFFASPILRAVGVAGTSVVAVAVLVALTLIPALLVLAGPRLIRPGVLFRVPGLRALTGRLGDISPAQGVFSRLAAGVQRRPLMVVLACLGVLAAAAWPVAQMEIVSSGATLLPQSSQQRQLFEDLDHDFPRISAAPIQVVSYATPQQLTQWGRQIANTSGVTSVDPVTRLGSGATAISMLGVRVNGNPRLSPARKVVDQLREQRPDYQIWVTGNTAQVHDVLTNVGQQAPWAIAVVALTTCVLLFLMTGSVLIPVKALLMNVISLGAGFGVLVWVFQQGHLQSMLGFTSNGGIDENIPALALAFAFGLSMDYEVFLLARVKELHGRLLQDRAREIVDAEGLPAQDRSQELDSPTDLAVRYGLQRSGRIITSAALIMIIVFGGFVAGQLLIIKELGVALAVSVAIDATIVRMLLVPATMTLLGNLNWWAPGPLKRLHDRIGLHEG